MEKKINKKSGFTLSEVLITLVIIGVVAAITVPSFLESTKNEEYITAFRKLYSSLGQFHTRLKADYGGCFYDIFADENTTYETFAKYYLKAYKCERGVTDTYCFPEFTEGTSSTQPDNNLALVLADGIILIFDNFSADCTSNVELNSAVGCVKVRADINGAKKPNKAGKDIFDFYITEDEIIVRGAPITTAYSNNYSSEWAKGYKILAKGAL